MQLIKSQEELIAQAQKMAEDFSKLKAKEYTALFLKNSHLGEELYALYEKEQFKNHREIYEKKKYLDLLTDDYQFALGQVLSIAYAIGFMDSSEKTHEKSYAHAKKMDQKPIEASPTKLILPSGE